MLVYRRVVGEMMIEPYGCGIHIVFSCIQMYPSEILKTAGYPDTAIITNTWEILGCPLYVNRDVNAADGIFTTETRPFHHVDGRNLAKDAWSSKNHGIFTTVFNWWFGFRWPIHRRMSVLQRILGFSNGTAWILAKARMVRWCFTSSASSILKCEVLSGKHTKSYGKWPIYRRFTY